ncbi:pilus assembly protein CpaE [Cricetibacter osteomyelitidis]|uniref:Pilus assembly protein CpaE n=1 Tax=Cricetibacter osteomyelitidis TaxID=1521931 RepID=A0A4R2T0R4_9PAST|nr:pilus assembly protein [Cricetibacter osteomyelitidis]TCP94656.1 pilus assembly protein CpaE [Cricetibacter osteomyelitidis]
MLLLDEGSTAVDSMRKVAVLSKNESTTKEVAQLLRTKGLENVKLVQENIFSDFRETFSVEDILGVIVDIGDESDVKIISEHIRSVVPQNMWCCVIGQSDSISLAQKLLEEGILYFHSGSQLNQMVGKILSGVNIPLVRNTVKINVLSCKGGIGASFISSHIASEISLIKKVKVMVVQGSNGSQDLDLLFDKNMPGDIVEYMPNLDLLKGDPALLSTPVKERYNFIIYDQPIFNVAKDDFEKFLHNSNTFILVVNRTIGALRVAKQFLDECERIRNTSGKPIRTFICISDHNAETSKLMAKRDIETLLKCSVDAIIPHLKKTAVNNVLSVNLGRNGKKELDSFVMKVIGAVPRNKLQTKKSLFASLFGALTNK